MGEGCSVSAFNIWQPRSQFTCSEENREELIECYEDQLEEHGYIYRDSETGEIAIIDEARMLDILYLNDEEIEQRLAIADNPLFDIPEEAYDVAIGRTYDWDEYAHTRIGYMPMTDDGPNYGIPLGGFGASGGIMRSPNGNFPVIDIVLGRHVYNDNDTAAAQFHVFQRIPSQGIASAQTLWTGAPEDGRLSSWNFNYPQGAGTYHALYPRAWSEYHHPNLPVRFAVQQFSPIVAGNYEETSLPVAIFQWRAYNPTDEDVDFSVMLTWPNMTGWTPREEVERRDMPGIRIIGGEQAQVYHTSWERDNSDSFNYHVNQGDIEGVVLTGTSDNISTQGEFCIAGIRTPGVSLSYLSRFDTDGDGLQAWSAFSSAGSLPNIDNRTAAQGSERLGAAIAISMRLAPGQTTDFPIALAWDFPHAEYGEGIVYPRYYTRVFGEEGNNSFAIARRALANYENWQRQIEEWQGPYLSDNSMPSWFRGALMNELYFLSAASLVWDANTGLFAVPESERDYNHSETTDVASYAFARSILWPDVEREMTQHIVDSVFAHNTNRRLHHIYQDGRPIPPEVRDIYFDERKALFAVPHDIGSFQEDPLFAWNTYNWQNPNIWPGLQTGLPLRVWRYFHSTGETDTDFILYNWPAVQSVMDYVVQMDHDGDFIPDHRGNVSDWTYDNWRVEGMTIYEAQRWLVALDATRRMAEIVGDYGSAQTYSNWYEIGRESINQRLWNGEYYDIFENNGDLFGDHLGIAYAGLLGLSSPLPEDRAISTFGRIFEDNVEGFGNGFMGMVTGTRNGEIIDGEQEREMWIGTSYIAAGNMLFHGLQAEAWQTAYGTYNAVYNHGLAFRTPEAITIDGTSGSGHPMVGSRCHAYYRPLAIWAIAQILEGM
jgi:non-lysosomal glucosylceramidase